MSVAQCTCNACVRRRAAQKRWLDKNGNRARVTAKNTKRMKAVRAAAKLQLSPDVSDEELDRRALAMERRQQWNAYGLKDISVQSRVLAQDDAQGAQGGQS